MKTIVSVTPLKVEEDSRTYKIAESFQRAGYMSKVVEMGHSNIQSNSFELISIYEKAREKVNDNKIKVNKKIEMKTTYTVTISLTSIISNIYRSIYNKYQFFCNKYHLMQNKFIRNSTVKIEFFHDIIYLINFVKSFYQVYFVKTIRFLPKASLYYLHAPYQFFAIYIKCIIYRAHFVYDAHDFYSNIENKKERDDFLNKFGDPFYEWNEKLCVQHASLVVTVSDGIAQLIQNKFNKKPIVIRNIQDVRIERPLKSSIREKFELSTNDFVIVIVGAGKKGQAIQELFEVIKSTDDKIKIIFLGKNHDDTKTMIKIMKLDKRVFIHKQVKPYEVTSFIRNADAAMIVYYSRSINYKYCLPNGFFQSITAGLPLIYPDLPEISKIVGKKEIGIMIDPRNKKQIKNALNQMLDDKIRAKFKKNVMEMKKTLTWENEEKILLDVLKNKLKLI